AKLTPRLLDGLCRPALAARSGRLLGSPLPRRSPPARLRSPGEGCQQVEARGLEVGRDPAAREQLPALVRDRRRAERANDLVERGVVPPARLRKDSGCSSAQVVQRLALRAACLVET